MFFAPANSSQGAKIRNVGVSKTRDNTKIEIKMPNPSQEPPASSKTPHKDLKDIDVLCTFKINVESQNFEHGSMKDQVAYPNQDQLQTAGTICGESK